jgi:hypothetical protein
VIFSRNGCSTTWNADSVRDRWVEVWNVATIGPSASISASIARLGAVGSCRCRTSKSCERIHLRTRA